MKALVRNKGETVTEDMGIPGIVWETGMPLTSPYWAEGPYTLIDDYTPETETVQDPISTESTTIAASEEQIAELKRLLAELENTK